MSLTVVGGQIITGDSALYQPWDSSRSTNPGAASADNRGCLPGWATLYVQDSMTGETVRVCRKLDAAILGPQGAQIIQEESSPDWYDESIITVASAAEEIVAGGSVVLGATGNVLGDALRILGPYLAIGGIAYLLLMNLPSALARRR